MKSFSFYLITIALFNSLFFYSIEACAVENDFQLWPQVYIKLPVNQKITTQLEISPRLGNNVTDLNQLLIRPSVGYAFNENVILWQGYAWTPNFAPRFRNENRIWQQLQLNNNFSKFNLINYLRLEERFIENTGSPSLRGRHAIQFEYPLDNLKVWTLILSNKLYFNFYSSSKGPNKGLDENRIFVGLNKKLTEQINLETGYQFQHLFKNGREGNKFIHAVLTSIFINI